MYHTLRVWYNGPQEDEMPRLTPEAKEAAEKAGLVVRGTLAEACSPPGVDIRRSVYSFPRWCRGCGKDFEPFWDEILATQIELNAVRESDDPPVTVQGAVNVIDHCPDCIALTLEDGQTRYDQAREFAHEQWKARSKDG